MTTALPTDDKRIGLIAGNGRFPIIFADNAKKMGYFVSAVAHIGEAEPELEQHVDSIHWVKIGQLGKLINAFKSDNVRRVVMLGGVKKTHVFTTVRPDFRALALFARVALWKDDDILREIAAEIEGEGITICESTFGLEGILVEEGSLASREPTKKSGRISGTAGRWRMKLAVWTLGNAWSSKIKLWWLSRRLRAPMARLSEAANWRKRERLS